MKRIIIIIITLAISATAFSQQYKQAIGVKIGYDIAVTYKLNLNETNFIDLGVDLNGFYHHHFGTQVYGFYNWDFNIGAVDGLSWYVGPGAYLGFIVDFSDGSAYFTGSVNAMIGLEYKIPTVPLAVSIDYTPGLAFHSYSGVHFAYSGGGVGLKYTF